MARKHCRKFQSAEYRVHERNRQTDDRQTDGRRHIANMNMSSRSLKIELKNGSFQYGKVALAVRTKKTSVTVCAQSGRRLRASLFVCAVARLHNK